MGHVPRRTYAVYAATTRDEHAFIVSRAHHDGLSISNYLRRCINSVLLEEGLDEHLLADRTRGIRSTKRHHCNRCGEDNPDAFNASELYRCRRCCTRYMRAYRAAKRRTAE